jgi:hypothetical protein
MTADAASATALAGLDNADELESLRLMSLSEAPSAGLTLKLQKLPLDATLAAFVLALVLCELDVAGPTVVGSVGCVPFELPEGDAGDAAVLNRFVPTTKPGVIGGFLLLFFGLFSPDESSDTE